jgi:hypothetical protein
VGVLVAWVRTHQVHQQQHTGHTFTVPTHLFLQLCNALLLLLLDATAWLVLCQLCLQCFDCCCLLLQL